MKWTGCHDLRFLNNHPVASIIYNFTPYTCPQSVSQNIWNVHLYYFIDIVCYSLQIAYSKITGLNGTAWKSCAKDGAMLSHKDSSTFCACHQAVYYLLIFQVVRRSLWSWWNESFYIRHSGNKFLWFEFWLTCQTWSSLPTVTNQ